MSLFFLFPPVLAIVLDGALEYFRVVPARGELVAPVPFAHKALPAAAKLGLAERGDVYPLLQVQVEGEEGSEGGEVAAGERAGVKGELLGGGRLPRRRMVPVAARAVVPMTMTVSMAMPAG